MSFKIDTDVNRFKDIIRNKVKHNLGKYVSSDHLLGQQGAKSIKIPIHNIDLPRFTYGGLGGVGQGEGEIGDPIDGSGKQGTSKGAGNEHKEHAFEAEFTPEDLAQMLGEELVLPDIQDKGHGKIKSTNTRYTGIRRTGPESLKSFKRTFKEALKRSIAAGSYDPKNPIIVPIREDKRFRSPDIIEQPNVNTVVIYMMDISGSMQEEQKHIVKSEVFWIDLWLQHQYKDIVSRFIVHDTEASEVDRKQFFELSAGGGTQISSAYEYCAHLIEKEHPFSEWNVYPFHFSDGDNWSDADNDTAFSILKNRILPQCNLFGYGQVDSPNGSGQFMKHLIYNFTVDDNIALSQIDSADHILNSIKTFFGKGK